MKLLQANNNGIFCKLNNEYSFTSNIYYYYCLMIKKRQPLTIEIFTTNINLVNKGKMQHTPSVTAPGKEFICLLNLIWKKLSFPRENVNVVRTFDYPSKQRVSKGKQCDLLYGDDPP